MSTIFNLLTCFAHFPARCQLPEGPRNQLTGIVHDLAGYWDLIWTISKMNHTLHR